MNSYSTISMPYALLVIDMQPTFKASEKVLAECLDEIYKANKRGSQIVFLEFWASFEQRLEAAQLDYHENRTHAVLLMAAKNKTVIVKYEQDGSKVAAEFFKREFGYIPSLRVCGVNTEFCVCDTVRGLSERSQNGLVVVKSACHSLYNHKFGLNIMKRLGNVLVA